MEEQEEGFGASRVLVKDVMSESPLIIKENNSVETAANLMKETNTGSLVVLDDKSELSGILTEMDIVGKLVSKGLDPEDIMVKDIMSTPVHTIESKKPVQRAAGKMADLKVRRLPVIDDKEMIGIITENDILEISPALIDITREYKRIKDVENEYDEMGGAVRQETSGYCESCGVYSEELISQNGQLICPQCE